MSARQAVAVAVLVALGGVVAVAPALGVVGIDAGQTDQDANATADDNTTSLGAQLSSFMQASAAETNGSVDAGMWAAKYNDTAPERRSEEIERRTATLEQRLDRLETRMAELEAERENGSTDPAYLARASRLAGEIASLKSSINETDEAATEAGVNDTRLDELRDRARNASGQEVARMARNLTVVRAGQRGPPAGTGPGDRGPPGNVGASDGGPPGDAGPGEAGEGQGPTGPEATPGSQGNRNASAGGGQGQQAGDDRGRAPGKDGGTTDDATVNGADDRGAGSGDASPGREDGGSGPNSDSAGDGNSAGGAGANPSEGGPPTR